MISLQSSQLSANGNKSFLSCFFNSYFENVIIVWEIWLSLATCQVLTHICVQDVPSSCAGIFIYLQNVSHQTVSKCTERKGKGPPAWPKGQVLGVLSPLLAPICIFPLLVSFDRTAPYGSETITDSQAPLRYGKSPVLVFDKMLMNQSTLNIWYPDNKLAKMVSFPFLNDQVRAFL